MRQTVPSRRTGITLRARLSVGVGVALLALVAMLLADALVRGRWDVALLSLPALGLVVCVAAEVFLRPGIRLHPDGVTVVNPLRTSEVPWSDVADVSTRFLVSVQTRSGRRISCWGAPAAARIRPTNPRTRGAARGGAAQWHTTSAAHRVIESYWAQHGLPDEPEATAAGSSRTIRRWHSVTLGVAVVLLCAAIRQLIIGS